MSLKSFQQVSMYNLESLQSLLRDGSMVYMVLQFDFQDSYHSCCDPYTVRETNTWSENYEHNIVLRTHRSISFTPPEGMRPYSYLDLEVNLSEHIFSKITEKEFFGRVKITDFQVTDWAYMRYYRK